MEFKTLIHEIAENLDEALTNSKERGNIKNVDWYIDVIKDKKLKLILSDLDFEKANLIMTFDKEDIFHAAMIVGSKNGLIPKSISMLLAMKSLDNLSKICNSLINK